MGSLQGWTGNLAYLMGRRTFGSKGQLKDPYAPALQALTAADSFIFITGTVQSNLLPQSGPLLLLL